MQYSQLGTTGTFVSRLCLGAMTFGGLDNAAGNAIGRLGTAEAERILGKAIDAGINFIDTADVYGGGGSECVLGEIIKNHRDELVIATKVSGRTGMGPNDTGHSRVHVMQALERSLRRLKTDHIDLYQLHNIDTLTPLPEVLRTLDDAVRQGKVRYIGCSNFAAWQLTKALGISAINQFERFVTIQSFYSLAGRDVETEILPAALDQGVGVLCWSPLAGGLLSGKFDRTGTPDKGARRAKINFPPVDEDKCMKIIDALRTIGENHSVSPAQVALAWLLSRRAVTSIIVGVRNEIQLTENLNCMSVNLTEGELNLLNEVSANAVAYPAWIHSYNAASRVPSGYPCPGPNWVLGEKPQ